VAYDLLLIDNPFTSTNISTNSELAATGTSD
jgi:hypothetical protein